MTEGTTLHFSPFETWRAFFLANSAIHLDRRRRRANRKEKSDENLSAFLRLMNTVCRHSRQLKKQRAVAVKRRGASKPQKSGAESSDFRLSTPPFKETNDQVALAVGSV